MLAVLSFCSPLFWRVVAFQSIKKKKLQLQHLLGTFLEALVIIPNADFIMERETKFIYQLGMVQMI